MIGPFDNQNGEGFNRVYPPEEQINLKMRYQGVEGEVGWKRITSSDPRGVVNLIKAFGDKEWVLAYAYTEINSPQPKDVKLTVGSDDGVKMWINGELILSRDLYRGVDFQPDTLPVTLQGGKNQILLKITQGVGYWEFFVKVGGGGEMKRGVALALYILLGVALGSFFRTLRSPDWMRGGVGGRPVPVLRQNWERGCGPATLTMLANAWGIDVSQEEMATLSGWTPKGVSMRGLVEAGERLGLEMVGVKLGINDLKKVNKPFIAHILPRHLVVVEDADDERVYIVDPAVGRMSLSIEEFSKRWKGYSLVVVRRKDSRSP